MESSKTYYGEAIINPSELIDTQRKGFMKLEYYGTKDVLENEFVEYGIEIVKKEYINTNFIQETNNISNVTDNKIEMEEIITILKRNKVTPIELEDIINDLFRKIAD